MKRRELITARFFAAAGLTTTLVTSFKNKSSIKKNEANIDAGDSFELNE